MVFQHNGESCCIRCTQPGENHRTEKGGNIRIFPYRREREHERVDIDDRVSYAKGPARTADQSVEDARSACGDPRVSHVNGIKGPSFLMNTPGYDFVNSTSIDSMHLLFLGVIRNLMKLMFTVTHASQPWSLYKYVDIIDKRLLQIKPPHFLSRVPRSVADSLKFWKANEYYSWFFYYALPCMQDLLPANYLYHYATLVEAVYLLSKESISDVDLIKADRLLSYFVMMMGNLYGERYLTINVHSLLHLCDTVRDLGPLWANSCFPFEDANGSLLKLFHGTQYVDLQIMNAIHVSQMVPRLVQDLPPDSPETDFIEVISGKAKHLEHRTHVIGASYQATIPRQVTDTIMRINGQPAQFYKRVNLNGTIIQSLDYSRVKVRNSYTVQYRDLGGSVRFGQCKTFALAGNRVIACIKQLRPSVNNIWLSKRTDLPIDQGISTNFLSVSLPHLMSVQESVLYDLVPVENIIELCVCTAYDVVEKDRNDQLVTRKRMFVCKKPNRHETNL